MSERTVEIPAFIEHLKTQNFPSLIDIGSHDTAFYARHAAELVTSYIGIDPLGAGNEDLYLDRIYMGKPWTIPERIADTVSCISVLEHCDHDEQLRICVTMAKMAKKSIFLSFPFGCGKSDTHTDITPKVLNNICEWTHLFRHTIRFYVSKDDPNGIHQVWLPTSKDIAAKHIFDPNIGVQCVCIVEGIKQ